MKAQKTISKVFPHTDAAVCIVTSEFYSPFASVVVASLAAHARDDRNYDVVMLSSDMTAETEAKFLSMARDNISIRIIDVSSIVEGFDFYTCSGVNANTYYRLFAPDIFADYSKLLYLDSDIVINRDIADLYGVELGENYMAEVLETRAIAFCSGENPDLDAIHYLKDELGLKDISRYFQGGVALFNLELMRRDFPAPRLIEEAVRHRYRYMDQDLTNVMFEGRILELPNNWNVLVSDHYGHIFEETLPEPLKSNYFSARKDPWIVHYLTRMMPCSVTLPDLGEYFWKAARLSPLYDKLLEILIETEVAPQLSRTRARVIGVLHD